MPRRKSVNVAGTTHVNPIPNACRLGNLIVSGGIGGKDQATGEMPAGLEAQVVNMFMNMKAIVEAAGGTTDDIVKVTVWLADHGNRKALNAEWLKMFPDADACPARHALQLPPDDQMLIQCDFMAVVG